MRIIGGNVFDGDGFAVRDLVVDQGRFVEAPAGVSTGEGAVETVDAAGCSVIPGLIDVHFHGCCGADLCDGTDEALTAIARHEARRGITSICPATMTYPEDTLARIVSVAAAHRPAADEARLVGINMEGPFISPGKIGAQNPAYVQVPDVDMMRRLQEAARGLVKLVDLAPESQGALDFIGQMAGEVRISLAHTTAGYDCAAEAFARGARQLTHLYNAMPGLHHREPGPIAAAFEHDEVTAELIADGVHIHPAMVRMAFTLFGDDRIILVSDTMRAAGLEDGDYDLGGQNVTVRGNTATLANGALAGSVTDLASCLKWAVAEAGIPLASAVKAATENPARAIGIADEAGSLAPGYLADAVILDQDLNVKHVILRGALL
ncbi:N-acetylglucosamine-6-phosphate deacetylase [Gordonibacter sp.]|uniref:N-acetylglucosamine-6-phosphate deacetylase n=1 Tax=Gordonibacter sp. TaxID=1968902 RepID=UPI002FCAF89B